MKATHQALSDEEVCYAIHSRKMAELDRLTELDFAIEAERSRRLQAEAEREQAKARLVAVARSLRQRARDG